MLIPAVSVLLVYEHALVKPNDLTRVNLAFFNIISGFMQCPEFSIQSVFSNKITQVTAY